MSYIQSLCESSSDQDVWNEVGTSILFCPFSIDSTHWFLIQYFHRFGSPYPIDHDSLKRLERAHINRYQHYTVNFKVATILKLYNWEFSQRATHILEETVRWSNELETAISNIEKYDAILQS